MYNFFDCMNHILGNHQELYGQASFPIKDDIVNGGTIFTKCASYTKSSPRKLSRKFPNS